MDRLSSGDQCGGEDAFGIQITVIGGGGADAVAFVRQGRMETVPVRFTVHSHRSDTHLFACPDDAHRDFPPVGDQDL